MTAEEMDMAPAAEETKAVGDQVVEAANKKSTSTRKHHARLQTQGEILKVDHMAKVAKKPVITSKMPNTRREPLQRRQRRMSSISLTRSCSKSL